MFNNFINYSKVLYKTNIDFKSIPGAGIVCALISVIFWSMAGLCIKLSDDVHAIEVLTISAVIQSFIYFLVMLCQNRNYFGEPEERIHLFLRCTLGTVSLSCLYTSYRLIPLSDATTIRFTAPLFVSLFAFLSLGEPFGPTHMLSAFLTISGVLLVGRPTFLFNSSEIMSADVILGLVLALMSAISISISMTAMRKLQKTTSAVVVFWFSMATVLFGLISLWILDQFKWPSNTTVWLLIIITGLSLAIDQYFITKALKLEHAGPVAMVQSLNVVFSFAFSFTILNENIRFTSFIGGALILLSIIIISAHKWCQDINQKESQFIDINSEFQSNPFPLLKPIDPSDPCIKCYIDLKQNKSLETTKL